VATSRPPPADSACAPHRDEAPRSAPLQVASTKRPLVRYTSTRLPQSCWRFSSCKPCIAASRILRPFELERRMLAAAQQNLDLGASGWLSSTRINDTFILIPRGGDRTNRAIGQQSGTARGTGPLASLKNKANMAFIYVYSPHGSGQATSRSRTMQRHFLVTQPSVTDGAPPSERAGLIAPTRRRAKASKSSPPSGLANNRMANFKPVIISVTRYSEQTGEIQSDSPAGNTSGRANFAVER